MEDKAITASYVMLQLNLLKDEILKGVEEKIRKVVQEELETIRTEFDEKLQNGTTGFHGGKICRTKRNASN